METGKNKTAVIIGAGPAGLTAAYELLTRTDIKPIILEADAQVGGISKTVDYRGNRIDIGGHRFFSKSDRVMQWWLQMLPLAESDSAAEQSDRVMLARSRLSRIFYMRKLFNYPISLNLTTVRNLGLWRMFAIGLSYLRVKIFPIQEENTLEDFLINRFGRRLYRTFFKDYTEKVWGVPCHQIKAEWGAQRIKGLSVSRAIFHAMRNLVGRDSSIQQKKTETSLIEKFLYPKFGPGLMWETTAEKVKAMGGQILLRHKAVGLLFGNGQLRGVRAKDLQTGQVKEWQADFIFSTMPVKELIGFFGSYAPQDVRQVAEGLVYRDFITVGLLLKKLTIPDTVKNKTAQNKLVRDNWIYIQESDVRVGRLQIFNNWSPYMVKNPDTVWIGLEYFCNEGDDLWRMSDDRWQRFAQEEMVKLNFISEDDVLDSVVIRMPKTYPAYFGSYDRFYVIREFVDRFPNLFLIGRNGMHRYNNQDHSMLTAMTAVDNIVAGITSKENIWQVNTEEEYHEEAS